MKKQRLISRLVAGSLVLLLPVLSLCGCTQQQAPDQAQVSALIEQAEGIYHPNHPALTSVENLLPFSNQDDPSDIRYYDEVEDYEQVAAQVFTDRAKQALEQVDKAERILHAMGYPAVRVRYHDDLARIELSKDSLKTFIQKEDLQEKQTKIYQWKELKKLLNI